MKSCIYKGQVSHRRFTPTQHEFSYALFMMYLDLDELPHLFDRFLLWSVERPNVASFRRHDHLGSRSTSLIEAVRDRVELETGSRPHGPIRLLTHLRYFGLGFNPVSFYYCFDAAGIKVETIVCEVNNTPWGEQHVYVLTEGHNTGSVERKIYRRPKEFHVSPFMPMDVDYKWRFSAPEEALGVHMENYRDGDRIFDATLSLKRTPIEASELARALIRFPWVTGKVVAGIYFEAMRLWLKKTPFYPHPAQKETPVRVKRA